VIYLKFLKSSNKLLKLIFSSLLTLILITFFFISRWGITKESVAIAQFLETVERDKTHTDFMFHSIGVYIYKPKPYICGSPDGRFTCHCHTKGIIEVKCLFTHRFSTVSEALDIELSKKNDFLFNEKRQLHPSQ